MKLALLPTLAKNPENDRDGEATGTVSGSGPPSSLAMAALLPLDGATDERFCQKRFLCISC